MDAFVASYMRSFISVYFERRGQALESLFHLRIPRLGVKSHWVPCLRSFILVFPSGEVWIDSVIG